jgi:DNA-binding MarR family transcriptional regulator
MAANSISRKTDLRLWVLVHRARHMMALCEDSIFAQYGITNEQFTVLGAVRLNGGSLRPTDLTFLLERSQNAISMLVDRMVKAGLVRKTRDKRDHRVVRVTLTSRGANAIELAIPEQWNLIQKILSRLAEKDKRVVASLLETVKCECLGYLNPEMDMAEIIKNSVTRPPRLPRSYERTLKDLSASSYGPKRKGGKKRSTVRRG